MEQFYIVNSTAKSVKTDLALALLRRRAEKDPSVYEALQERGREWQVDGQAIVEQLALESQIWRQRVRLPSMPKGETTIPSASMVTSLEASSFLPIFWDSKKINKSKSLTPIGMEFAKCFGQPSMIPMSMRSKKEWE